MKFLHNTEQKANYSFLIQIRIINPGQMKKQKQIHVFFYRLEIRKSILQWRNLLIVHTIMRYVSAVKDSTDCPYQGTNARKVISEVYAFFVLQCTVFGRKCKHKTDVTAWHGSHFHKNNLWNILVIGNYYVNFQNYQN